MRDWKSVAKAYDKFVFDKNKTGSYLPLIEIKSQGNNYPGSKQIRLDTYVGSNSHGSQAEAININLLITERIMYLMLKIFLTRKMNRMFI